MYKEFLDSLKPGTCITNIYDNPFEEDYVEEIIVLEVRKSKFGETWVKIEFSDGTIGYSTAQELWEKYN